MAKKTEYQSVRITGVIIVILSIVEAVLIFGGPIPLANLGTADSLYILLIALHLAWGIVLLSHRAKFSRKAGKHYFQVPELLLVYSLVLFLFSYIFALNANMDYVQRYIQSGGNLRLALNTETERGLVLVRIFPFLAVDVLIYLFQRLSRPGLAPWLAPRAEADQRYVTEMPHHRGTIFNRRRHRGERTVLGNPRNRLSSFVKRWALLLVLASVFLTVIAIPSFLSTSGIGILGWISLVPLFLVFRESSYWRTVFYGIVFGVFSTLLTNYWLGTFSLVSLQITVAIFLVNYTLFMLPAAFVYRHAHRARFLIFPLAWTAFEYARSSGFLGYPWGLLGHSQYAFLPVIQIASITGVWGVSFLILLANSVLAESVWRTARRARRPGLPLLVGAAAVGITIFGGALAVVSYDAHPPEPERTVKIALVQQNSDPRKHNYDVTFESLKALTNQALTHNPDLVVWSETAFVPNIRKWSQEDPKRYRYARLVQDLLRFQKSTHTWLLTGNDDYSTRTDSAGNEIRLDYNAAVLFSDTGKRVNTYHKIKLVPFTEYFPYKKQLPAVYKLLQDFDVTFWEPGTERTVFEHPKFRFSTPICFEDAFPDGVRRFVTHGAQVIVNISNDYWSLTDSEAKQHFVASLFRAVENRVPVLRATASGLTGQVDPYGHILQTAPYYKEAYLMADVPIVSHPETIYTKFGDWFPWASVAGVILLLVWSLLAVWRARMGMDYMEQRLWDLQNPRRRRRFLRNKRADREDPGVEISRQQK